MITKWDGDSQVTTLLRLVASQSFDPKGAFIFLNTLEGDFSSREGQARYLALHACVLAALDGNEERDDAARALIMNFVGELELQQKP